MKNLTVNATEFIVEASNAGTSISDIMRNPESISKNLKKNLSSKEIDSIKTLHTSKFVETASKYDKDVINYFSKVVEDGRFVEKCFLEPKTVSEKLDIYLSEGQIEMIPNIPIDDIISSDDAESGVKYVVILGSIIVILMAANDNVDELGHPPPVIDLSAHKKI